MKKYLRIILVGSLLLLLFPFLGLPEVWEYLYVSIIGFSIGTAGLLIWHTSGIISIDDEEASLQTYIQELQRRFKDHKNPPTPHTPQEDIKTKAPISIEKKDI